MKDKTKFELTVWIVAIIFVAGLVIFGQWNFEKKDWDCLKEKANDYCAEQSFDGSFVFSYVSFSCYSQIGDERNGFENETEMFYFTEEEDKECLIKERHSWRKLK